MELDYGQVGAVHLAAVHEAEQVLEHVGVSAVEVDALHPILDGVVLEKLGQLGTAGRHDGAVSVKFAVAHAEHDVVEGFADQQGTHLAPHFGAPRRGRGVRYAAPDGQAAVQTEEVVQQRLPTDESIEAPAVVERNQFPKGATVMALSVARHDRQFDVSDRAWRRIHSALGDQVDGYVFSVERVVTVEETAQVELHVLCEEDGRIDAADQGLGQHLVARQFPADVQNQQRKPP